jgi:hypothetical protein
VVLHTHISPGDKQYTRWWPQFRDVVSPHLHHHHRILLKSRLSTGYDALHCASYHSLLPLSLLVAIILPSSLLSHTIMRRLIIKQNVTTVQWTELVLFLFYKKEPCLLLKRYATFNNTPKAHCPLLLTFETEARLNILIFNLYLKENTTRLCYKELVNVVYWNNSYLFWVSH